MPTPYDLLVIILLFYVLDSVQSTNIISGLLFFKKKEEIHNILFVCTNKWMLSGMKKNGNEYICAPIRAFYVKFRKIVKK